MAEAINIEYLPTETGFVKVKVCSCPDRCFQCPDCKMKPRRKKNTSQYSQQESTGLVQDVFKNPGFLCEYCGKHFQTSKGSLDRHIREQHKDKEMQCRWCDYATARKEHLISHERRVHNMLFCNSCFRHIQFV